VEEISAKDTGTKLLQAVKRRLRREFRLRFVAKDFQERGKKWSPSVEI